jgi:hypothetical protein
MALPKPFNGVPWDYPLPQGVPNITGGAFNGWGWVQNLFNYQIPSVASDLAYWSSYDSGTFV